jgi:hypothetical protein
MSFTNPTKIEENFSSIGMRKLKLICIDNMGYKLEEKKESEDIVPARNTSDIFFDSIINSLTSQTNSRNNIISNNPASRILSNMSTGSFANNSNSLVSSFFAHSSNVPQTPTKTKPKMVKKNNVESERKEVFEKLLKIIELIEEKMITLNEKAEELKEEYNNMDKSDKKLIETSLTKYLETGLAMRGWKVITGTPQKPQLPIKSEDTIIPPIKQDEVSDMVNQSIVDFETSLSKLTKRNAILIKSLTLVNYRVSSDGKLSFKESNDSDDGFTVWDRILIVKEGDTSKNQCACIRLSSNWICSSAYYYMIAIGISAPFVITELAQIS